MWRLMARLDLWDSPQTSEEDLAGWGRVLCVAPHPDDEALGGGGTLARLASLGNEVGVAWVSDGAGSHPNSLRYAAPKLAELREREARESGALLGVKPENLYFLRLTDGALPFPQDANWALSVENARKVLERFRPDTLLLPWRRDPHRDHRATWTMWAQAATFAPPMRRLEYLVWAFERAAQDEWPDTSEASALRVAVSDFLPRKRAAIAAHASQTTHLIDDDPMGFWLSPAVLKHFDTPDEAFIAPFYSSPELGETALPAFER